MGESELAYCFALLGVPSGTDREVLKRALVQKNFVLIRGGAPEAERAQLRVMHDTIVAHLDEIERQQRVEDAAPARADLEEKHVEQLVAEVEQEFEEPKNGLHDEFGWTQHDIIFTYHHLGNACLTVMIGLWVFFGLRLDQMVARVLGR
jgi:hypothetical protein